MSDARAVSIVVRSFSIRQLADQMPQVGFPPPDAGDKKFNSRPVAPTFFTNEPFGELVEGLSHLWGQELRLRAGLVGRYGESVRTISVWTTIVWTDTLAA